MKNKYSRSELSKEILKGLALGGFITACFIAPNFAQVTKLFNTKNPKDRWRIKRTLANLTKEKLVKISYNKKGEEIIKITGEGEKRVLKYKYEELEIDKPKKWDKKWRLVLFDIPELHKKSRNALTHKLQDLGFYPLQKSVFIYPFDCRNEIDFICNHFKIREFVNFFVLTEAENEEYLKEWFNL